MKNNQCPANRLSGPWNPTRRRNYTGVLCSIVVFAGAILWVGCSGLHMRVTPLGTRPGSPPPIRLFPILHSEPEPVPAPEIEARGYVRPLGHTALLWPFMQLRYRTSADGKRDRIWGLHPLFSRTTLWNERGRPGKTVRTDFIWPFFQFTRKERPDGVLRKKLFIPPLFLRQIRIEPRSDGSIERRKRHFLFPILWSGSTRVIDPEEKGLTGRLGVKTKSFFYLLPFIWRSRGEPSYLPHSNPDGTDYSWYWPFYGSIDYGPKGSRWRTKFYLWPLFVWSRSLDDPGLKSLSIVWPFLRFQWGAENTRHREVKFWPLFQWKTIDDHYRRYLLWPFFIWRNASTDEYVDRQLMIFPLYWHSRYKDAVYRIFFPFSGYYRDEDERATFVLWPLFARWNHEGYEFKETQILWHIIRWRHSTSSSPNTLRQIFPFYNYTNFAGRETWFRPLLLWHGSRRTRYDGQERMNYRYNGRFSFPFWFSKRRDYEDGRLAFSRFFFPVLLWQREPNGTYRFRGLWPLWQEEFQGLQRNWTPLWSFFDWRKFVLNPPEGKTLEELEKTPVDIIKRHDLFGYLYRTEFGTGFARRQFNLGPLSYDRFGDQRAISILGGWFPIVWGSPEEENLADEGKNSDR